MEVVGGLLYQFVKVRIVMLSVHTLIECSGYPMPKMTYYRVDEKELTVLIPVVSPRVSGAFADNLEHMSRWMVAPNTTAKFHTGLIRSSRFAHLRSVQYSMPPIKPAVWAPL